MNQLSRETAAFERRRWHSPDMTKEGSYRMIANGTAVLKRRLLIAAGRTTSIDMRTDVRP